MLFNSIDFLVFFPVVTGIYFFIPKRIRYVWVLAASYYFYMSWNPRYLILLIFSTIVTYLTSLMIAGCERTVQDRRREALKKLSMAVGIGSNLLLLIFFKYANFLVDSLNQVLSGCGIAMIEYQADVLLPVGISFYTFQALGYMIDVYRGEISIEKNIFRYALFVSFFPQLVAGPIERSKNLLSQIQNMKKIEVWNFNRIREGLLLMGWGFFQKLVIADRISLYVNQVYHSYRDYGFAEIGIATILFAFQIYCDFSGYTDIARGAAQVMGITLMGNFRQPYLADSVKEFWRRWHISLTSWFTDYLYIPLGGNKKGKLKQYRNIFLVFSVSGLWHGASWSFLVWGGVNAIYQILEDLHESWEKNYSISKRDYSRFLHFGRIAVTFLAVDFAWIFFAAGNLKTAFQIITQMFSKVSTVGILGVDFRKIDWLLLLAGGVILMTVDLLHEKKISVFELVNRQKLYIRWTLYLGLIWGTILFGIYGINYDAGQFIYFQF